MVHIEGLDTLLKEHPFFEGISDEYGELVAGCAANEVVRAGGYVFREGDPADKFYLLRNGEVSVHVPALVGPVFEIQSLGKDQVLGWSWLIQPYRWSFQARVMQDTDIIEFDGEAIRAHCESDPRFGYGLFKRFAALMSERLAAARQTMMDQWNPPGFARAWARLSKATSWAEKMPGGRSLAPVD